LEKRPKITDMFPGWNIAAERLPIAAISTDGQGHILAFNRRAATLFATTPAEMAGISIGRLIPGADVLIAAGMRSDEDLVRLVGLRGDTGEFPLEIAIARDGADFLAVVRDMTAEMRASDIETWAQIGTFERELATGRVAWSAEMYRLCGVDPDTYDPSTHPFIELVHPEDRNRLERALASSRRSTDPVDSEFRILRPDGDVRTLAARGRRIADRHIGMVRDVTDARLTPPAMARTSTRGRPRGTGI
jgi:PAS domain-containing protein